MHRDLKKDIRRTPTNTFQKQPRLSVVWYWENNVDHPGNPLFTISQLALIIG